MNALPTTPTKISTPLSGAQNNQGAPQVPPNSPNALGLHMRAEPQLPGMHTAGNDPWQIDRYALPAAIQNNNFSAFSGWGVPQTAQQNATHGLQAPATCGQKRKHEEGEAAGCGQPPENPEASDKKARVYLGSFTVAKQ